MKYVKIIAGIVFILAGLFAFGVGCAGKSWNIDWLSNFGSKSFSQFGKCVANIDHLFDREQDLIALGLMILAFMIAAAFFYSAFSKKKKEFNPLKEDSSSDKVDEGSSKEDSNKANLA
ncbi:MAG: hypothetical protein JRJ87_24940 [Deltaproteobacteria bacterium]|nr:hypothetical protein [Deltaproteobacteria bacterium]